MDQDTAQVRETAESHTIRLIKKLSRFQLCKDLVSLSHTGYRPHHTFLPLHSSSKIDSLQIAFEEIGKFYLSKYLVFLIRNILYSFAFTFGTKIFPCVTGPRK